ncbi:MAG TPA: hypothetical protein VGH87_30370, partial [Polyangiaceae bacterium]
MRSRAFLLCGIAGCLLPACGLVSGLDTLRVGDASAGDASDDGSSDPDVVVVIDDAMVGIACGTMHCAPGATCCANKANGTVQYQYDCAKGTNGCAGQVVLDCDDKSDCTSSTAPLCCFANARSQCSAGASTGCAELCNSASQCSSGFACVPFDAGYGLSLS